MQSFRACVGGLVKETRPVRGKILVSVLLGACQVAASLFFVWISKRVVDIATGHYDGPLDSNVAIMAGIMLVQILLAVAARYWEGLIVIKDANRTRSAVFERVMHSTWNGRDRFHSGDTVNRIVGDINEVVDFVCINLPQCIVTLLQLVAAALFLYKLSPALMWILLVIMPVAVVASRLFFRRMRRLSGEIRAQDSVIQGHMQENIQHRVVVKTLGATSGVIGKLSEMQSILQGKTISRLRYAAFSRGFMQFGFSAGYALAFFWGVYGLHNGTVTYGLMVAFLQLVGQIQRPVADIARHIPAFIRALASEERLQELLKKATSLSDIIELESALTEVQSEINMYQSDLNHYDSLIGYSTINIDICQVAHVGSGYDQDNGFFARLGRNFINGLRDFAHGIENFIMWIARNIVPIVIIAAVIIVIWKFHLIKWIKEHIKK